MASKRSANSKILSWLRRHGSLPLAGLVTTSCLVWVLTHIRHGYFIADEGLYLQRIADPFEFRNFLSLFGFAYFPLFRALQFDIGWLRLANVAVLFYLGGHLAYRSLSPPQIPDHNPHPWGRLVAAGCAAFISIGPLAGWTLTPSYNTLALTGLLIVAIAMLGVVRSPRKVCGYWLLWGAGGWLAYLGKPTTAFAVLILSGIFVHRSGRLRTLGWTLALSCAGALLLLTLLSIFGSLNAYVERSSAALERLHLIKSGHGWTELIATFRLLHLRWLVPVALLLGAVLALKASLRRRLRTWLVDHTAQARLACVLLNVLCVVFTSHWIPLKLRGTLLALASVGAWFLGYWSLHGERSSTHARDIQLVAFVLSFMPHAYSFGSNLPFASKAGEAACFWLSSAALYTGSRGPSPTAQGMPYRGAAMLTATSGLLSLLYAELCPQKRASPSESNFVEVKFRHSTLKLHPANARFVTGIVQAMRDAGFRAGDPVIDLSGVSPGIVYAIEGRAMGSAWLVGAYPGSEDHARVALRSPACEDLARAWVLTAPRGPRPISSEVLDSIGAELTRDYQRVATPLYEHEGRARIHLPLEIWRPQRTSSAAKVACELSRKAKITTG